MGSYEGFRFKKGLNITKINHSLGGKYESQNNNWVIDYTDYSD